MTPETLLNHLDRGAFGPTGKPTSHCRAGNLRSIPANDTQNQAYA